MGKLLSNPLFIYRALALAVTILTMLGLVMVFSSSSVTLISNGADPMYRLIAQGVAAIAGLAVAIPVVLFLTPKILTSKFVVYGSVTVVAALLLAVLIVGTEINGSKSWISIPGIPMTLQPSEFVKFVIAIESGYFLGKKVRINNLKDFLMPAGFIFLAFCALIMVEKDLGTASIVVIVTFVAYIIANTRWSVMATIFIPLATAAGIFVAIEPHRLTRFTAFLTGCTDPQIAVCYQVIHARYAFANGGLFGAGLGQSIAKWNYVPYADTDFIFSIIGEELGYIACVIIVILFLLIMFCMIRIADYTADRVQKIAIYAIIVYIPGQALLNIAVTLGIAPAIGIPLPLISGGGTSLIVSIVSIAFVLCCAKNSPPVKEMLGATRGGIKKRVNAARKA
ncbi:MAG: FtsW/RodA/SpoVE family cell cycle protein [Bifidobacteriaceae bacterium]|nr:FtsW/RodA/SpoVE family cell cycle protein [Bifidobacteriaceae bacterium]